MCKTKQFILFFRHNKKTNQKRYKKQYINTYNTTDDNTWLLSSEIDKYLDKISQKQEKAEIQNIYDIQTPTSIPQKQTDQNVDEEIGVLKIFKHILTKRKTKEVIKVKQALRGFYTQVCNGKKHKFFKQSDTSGGHTCNIYVYNKITFIFLFVNGKEMLLAYKLDKEGFSKEICTIVKNQGTDIDISEHINLSEWLGNNKESKETIESLSCGTEIINADEHSKKDIIANDETIIRNDINTETAPVKQEPCAEKDILPVPNLEKATATRMTNKMLEIEELNRQIDWYVKYCTWLTKRLNSMSLSEHQRNIGQKNYELASKKIHERTAAIKVKICEQLKLIAR